jgi:release factor glutamine methyltransferase
MAYLTGIREFWSFELDVTPAVLIPRQETEILVESVIKHFQGKAAAIADIGAGSGAICIALAKELPEAGVYATEVSREAMEVAQRNVDKHQLGDRVSLLYGDLLRPLEEAGLRGRLNTVVSNPPYIPSGEIDNLQPEVRFEPRGALDGGPDGLDVIRRLLSESPEYLVPGGMFFTEIGFDQGEAVKELAVQAGFVDVIVVKDLAGLDRVVWGTIRA